MLREATNQGCDCVHIRLFGQKVVDRRQGILGQPALFPRRRRGLIDAMQEQGARGVRYGSYGLLVLT
jgi:hypothetical protein